MFGVIRVFFIAVAFMATIVAPARADIATLGWVYKQISIRWGMDIPHDTDTNHRIFNRRAMMRIIDTTNELLNKVPTSDFVNDPAYAADGVVNADYGKHAIDTMIREIDYKFFFTPATDGHEYGFQLAASGTFYIDWGDGNVQKLIKTNVDQEMISHTYADAANLHTIKLAGAPTRYHSFSTYTPTITFRDEISRLKSMDGCIGCVFPVVENGAPCFYGLFENNTDLKQEIPPNLFKGIGQAVTVCIGTFGNAFRGCTGLHGEIPAGLFDGLQPIRTPGGGTFSSTFKDCRGLTGEIPAGLFDNFVGDGTTNLFYNTFENCAGLTGPIPSGLFAGITKTGIRTFAGTFRGCTGLTSIPEDLFSDLTEGDGIQQFNRMFSDCTGLKGPSARVGPPDAREYLYERWPDAPGGAGCYTGATGLSDWDNIPTTWGGPKAVAGD